jgi:hypothetical protein
MQKNAKNLENIEHREWHNLYGFFLYIINIYCILFIYALLIYIYIPADFYIF